MYISIDNENDQCISINRNICSINCFLECHHYKEMLDQLTTHLQKLEQTS